MVLKSRNFRCRFAFWHQVLKKILAVPILSHYVFFMQILNIFLFSGAPSNSNLASQIQKTSNFDKKIHFHRDPMVFIPNWKKFRQFENFFCFFRFFSPNFAVGFAFLTKLSLAMESRFVNYFFSPNFFWSFLYFWFFLIFFI